VETEDGTWISTQEGDRLWQASVRPSLTEAGGAWTFSTQTWLKDAWEPLGINPAVHATRNSWWDVRHDPAQSTSLRQEANAMH